MNPITENPTKISWFGEVPVITLKNGIRVANLTTDEINFATGESLPRCGGSKMGAPRVNHTSVPVDSLRDEQTIHGIHHGRVTRKYAIPSRTRRKLSELQRDENVDVILVNKTIFVALRCDMALASEYSSVRMPITNSLGKVLPNEFQAVV